MQVNKTQQKQEWVCKAAIRPQNNFTYVQYAEISAYWTNVNGFADGFCHIFVLPVTCASTIQSLYIQSCNKRIKAWTVRSHCDSIQSSGQWHLLCKLLEGAFECCKPVYQALPSVLQAGEHDLRPSSPPTGDKHTSVKLGTKPLEATFRSRWDMLELKNPKWLPDREGGGNLVTSILEGTAVALPEGFLKIKFDSS